MRTEKREYEADTRIKPNNVYGVYVRGYEYTATTVRELNNGEWLVSVILGDNQTRTETVPPHLFYFNQPR